MTRFKIYAIFVALTLALIIYGLLQVEFIKKKVFDIKADITGSSRTVTFYSKIDATKVASYQDSDVRFEYTNGAVSVWLGSQNKKVHSNMDYIIEDK